MAARDEEARKAADRKFADQVNDLIKATMAGEPPEQRDDDAYRLACAFVLLDRLVGQYASISPHIAGGEGAWAAQDMLVCLQSGYQHPVWRYINGVRTQQRSGKATPAELTERAYVVGLMLALQKAGFAKGTRAAARQLEDDPYFRDRNLRESKLRHWPGDLQAPPAIAISESWRDELSRTGEDGTHMIRLTVTRLKAIEAEQRPPSLEGAAKRRPLYAKIVDNDGKLVNEIEIGPQSRPDLG